MQMQSAQSCNGFESEPGIGLFGRQGHAQALEHVSGGFGFSVAFLGAPLLGNCVDGSKSGSAAIAIFNIP